MLATMINLQVPQHLTTGSNPTTQTQNMVAQGGGMLHSSTSIGNQSILLMARGMTWKCTQFICLGPAIIIFSIRHLVLYSMSIITIKMLLRIRFSLLIISLSLCNSKRLVILKAIFLTETSSQSSTPATDGSTKAQ